MAQRVVLRRDSLPEAFVTSAHDITPVQGLTHFYYRYPARFSPQFAKAAIDSFTRPGQLVLDPFMGSGTTIVESRIAARASAGIDISELACFIANVKSTVYTQRELALVEDWCGTLPSKRSKVWPSRGEYQRNLHNKETWSIRKSIEWILWSIQSLKDERLTDFARCALLKTSQWALDCRSSIPSAAEFRVRFGQDMEAMIAGARDFSQAAKAAQKTIRNPQALKPVIRNRSAVGLNNDPVITALQTPSLVLTSPPYPGVHILYHRWQIKGRKETDAPFWISYTNDGAGASFYTFGDRKNKSGDRYYSTLLEAFTSVAAVCDDKTWVVQLVSFSSPRSQLPRYLDAMSQAGFQEVVFSSCTTSDDARIWRVVPNRKWYNNASTRRATELEVVLFHRLR